LAKKDDITSQVFGKLKVLYYDGSRNNYRFYMCQCECGNKKSIKRRLLVRGHTKSCGCDWRLANKNHNGWRGYGDIPKDFFSNIRRGAESRNIEFDITIEYLWDLFLQQNGKCALSGLDINFSQKRKDYKNRTVSVDRKDSSLGYIEGNVQWVHKLINIMKNKTSDIDFIQMCKYVSEKNK
jgi:hypothetical protein